ncbi:MAG: lysylphosphatidylglycerol synthase transmembrane domain-containing protein [bacterium]|nr:lysylphosphatidylglycerol synthase transmembrane domain-containing protein [bacterium]
MAEPFSSAKSALPGEVLPLAGPQKKPLRIIARIVLTVGLLVVLFWQVRWKDVWIVVVSLDTSPLLWACLLWIPTQYFQFAKWNMLAREAGAGVSRQDIHRGYWVGFTLGLITPGRIGQFGRALALHNCSLSRAFGLTVIERAYTAITINSFGLLALVMLPILGWLPPFARPGPFVQSACIVAGTALLILGIFPRSLHAPLIRLARHLPLREKIEKALAVLQSASPRQGIVLILLSIGALAASLMQFVLLIRAAGTDIPMWSGMLAGVLTFFIKGALPISLGSLGVGEWTAVYCFTGLGTQASVAVAASLLLFTINVFIPSLIGLPFIHTLRVPHWPTSKSSSVS